MINLEMATWPGKMIITASLIVLIHINIGSCCKFPNILNPVWIKECSAAKPPLASASKPKQTPKKAAISHSGGLLDILIRPRRQATQEPHYDSKGFISPATIAANVASSISDEWSNIVAAAMTDCADVIEVADYSATPAPRVKGSSCNYKAEFYMNCINRVMILTCAKEGKAKADAKSCPAKIQKVDDCDPMIAVDPPPPKSEMSDFDAGAQYLPSMSERVFKDSDVKAMFANDDGEEYDYSLMQGSSAKTSAPKKTVKKPVDAKKLTPTLTNNNKKPVAKKPAKKV